MSDRVTVTVTVTAATAAALADKARAVNALDRAESDRPLAGVWYDAGDVASDVLEQWAKARRSAALGIQPVGDMP
ncbi:MAG: hypothetical protein GY719_15490 [bacterium]|nr:hypothetical protein [bacterium]